jgi:hypothetical protein
MAKIIAFYLPSHFQKDIAVDLGGTKGEGHRVQLSRKEVGLSGKAIGLSQALLSPVTKCKPPAQLMLVPSFLASP